MSVTKPSENLIKITQLATGVATIKDRIQVGKFRKAFLWAEQSNVTGAPQLDIKIHNVQPEAATPAAAGEKVQIGSTITIVGANFGTPQQFGENAASPGQFLANELEIEEIRTVGATVSDYEIWIELRE